MVKGDKNFFLTLKAAEAAKTKLESAGYVVLGYGAIEMAYGETSTVRPALISMRVGDNAASPESLTYMLFEDSHVLERDPKFSYTDYVLLKDRPVGDESQPLKITNTDPIGWVDWET
ncbi:MAG: hypothetical protein JWN90_13 [Parcubacteria group bacterium]|nr:hypothetical protein [Parcubacteria group bacterium]